MLPFFWEFKIIIVGPKIVLSKFIKTNIFDGNQKYCSVRMNQCSVCCWAGARTYIKTVRLLEWEVEILFWTGKTKPLANISFHLRNEKRARGQLNSFHVRLGALARKVNFKIQLIKYLITTSGNVFSTFDTCIFRFGLIVSYFFKVLIFNNF